MPFPLQGAEGFYPAEMECIVCGTSLRKSPQNVRIFVGARSTDGTKLHGSHFTIDLCGPELPGTADDGCRIVNVLPENNDAEAQIEFCSVVCLRGFFEDILRALE